MNDDIILNKMFIQWESTKKDSWKNLWEWMYWMAGLFSEKWVWVDVYSKTDKWYFAKWFSAKSFDSIIKDNKFDKESYANFSDKEYYWEDWEFPNETWTEFIFKFPIKNK